MERNLTHKYYIFVFYTLLFLVVADRVLHLYFFSFQYADSDQTILWLGTMQMLQGHFHEPAFYGQAYNTFFEGILALPLVALGIPVYKALPIVTAFLATFPFVLFAFLCKQKNKIAALLFLLIPLLLPTAYILLTQLPRGFVTGIFMASLAAAAILFSPQRGIKKFLLSGFFGCFALVLNPNAILVLLPVYLFVLFTTQHKLKLILFLFLGAIPALLWQGFVFWFYSQHPDYVVHTYEDKTVSLGNFLNATLHFHELFYGLFPVLIFAGAAIIPLLFFIAYRLHKCGKKPFATALIFTLLFVFLTFFSSKISDGTPSIFFAYSRMFLGLPLVMGLGFYFLTTTQTLQAKHLRWGIPIVLAIVALKFIGSSDRVNWNVRNNSGYVHVFEIEKFTSQCDEIKHISDSLDLQTLIIYEKNDVLNYGLMATTHIKTINLSYDRKNWLLAQEIKENRNYPFLFWCATQHILPIEGLSITRVSQKFPLYRATTTENPLMFFKKRWLLNKRM